MDSLCAGCGKTLRVNDEFVGRKARCPVCGLVYVVGGAAMDQSTQMPASVDPAVVETSYQPKNESNAPILQPLEDSWSSLPTERPIDERPIDERPIEKSLGATEPTSTSQAPIQAPMREAKYFVRTPNAMVYGPSDTATVLNWITQGRLDDSCHIREEFSEQWIGIAAWRFQSRKLQNPMARPIGGASNPFGTIPNSAVQSAGYSKSGNGTVVLVLGIVSWILCPTFFGAVLCSILAIAFASNEFGKIRNGQSPDTEKTAVYIGLWLSIANLVIWCFLIVGVVVASILSP